MGRKRYQISAEDIQQVYKIGLRKKPVLPSYETAT
jgi:hypothetical protein